MELKTLKDLDLEGYPDHRTKAILRQEAREWIKFLESNKTKCEDGCPFDDVECYLSCGDFPAFIKMFFNITEEDLKASQSKSVKE